MTNRLSYDPDAAVTVASTTLSGGQAADGAAVSGNPVRVGGKDGSGNTQDIITDTDGHLQVDVLTSGLPTGASTLAEQQTQTTALAAIQTAVELLDNTVSGTELQVDVVTSALPTGAATAANQATGNTTLAAIQTAVETIDNAVAGNELQVDVITSALPAGAATAANQSTANTALSAIQTAAEIMDDWDESDRAKVNVIVGQAGITGGAGAVAANTPRVTLASDAPFFGDRVTTVVASGSAATWTAQRVLAAIAMYDGASGMTNVNTVRQATGGNGAGAQAVGEVPSNAATQCATSTQTSAAADSLVAKASAGNCYGVNVNAANAGWVYLFDATAEPTGGGAAVTPKKVFYKAANESVAVQFSPPIRCGTGITVTFSSTGPFTYTEDATAFISVDYL